MDWTGSADGLCERTGVDGHRWVIRDSETVGDAVALYRLASGSDMPDEPDEEADACAILRSVGEARIMSGLLEGRAAADAPMPSHYEPTSSDGYRRNWRMATADGFVSLHLGTDEDRRDVVSTRFSRRSPGVIKPVLIICHGPNANMPEAAAPLPAAVELLELIDTANRFDSPLDEVDAQAWDAGRPIRREMPDDASDILGTRTEIVEAAMLLEQEGGEHAHLLAEALTIMDAKGQSPERSAAVSTSPAAQYAIVATVRGKDVADALVEAGRSPSP